MIKGCLSFYGTVGPGPATLEIDRTAPVDLTPFFKYMFNNHIDDIAEKEARVAEKRADPSSWTIRDKKEAYKQIFGEDLNLTDPNITRFTFKIDDFFSTIMYRYKPQEFAKFISENVKDPDDFGNEGIIKRLNRFYEDYARVFFHAQGSFIMIQPIDGIITPIDIEEMIKPTDYRKVSQEAKRTYHDLNEGRKITTKPYHCSLENHLEKTLQNRIKKKKIIRVYDHHGGVFSPKLNLFDIISKYNLPTEHLDIVLKDVKS